MWVVEWTAYMPDIDATNELNPICEIAVLTDTDGEFSKGLSPRGVV